MRIYYVGDPVTAVALRLVGVVTLVPKPDPVSVRAAVESARGDADLLIINQTHAAELTTPATELVVAKPDPPMIVLPSLDDDAPVAVGAISRAKRVLGLS